MRAYLTETRVSASNSAAPWMSNKQGFGSINSDEARVGGLQRCDRRTKSTDSSRRPVGIDCLHAFNGIGNDRFQNGQIDIGETSYIKAGDTVPVLAELCQKVPIGFETRHDVD